MRYQFPAPFEDLEQKWNAIRKWRLVLVAIGLLMSFMAHLGGVFSLPVVIASCLAGLLGLAAYFFALRGSKEIALFCSLTGILFMVAGADRFLGNAPFWVWAINGWAGAVGTLGVGAFFPIMTNDSAT